MVYGAKANKPPSSTDPKHKRRTSLLNSDFKIISGIIIGSKRSPLTLSTPINCQLAVTEEYTMV
jgi:hypothetical protein